MLTFPTFTFPTDPHLDMTEIRNLAEGLRLAGIPFEEYDIMGGKQIKTDKWDAVCHSFSYGHEQGLLEIMGSIVHGDDDVEGYLHAYDIFARL